MSTLFGNLNNEGLEETQDVIGGFSVFETDGYDAEIKMFYATKSGGGANGIFLEVDIAGKTYRETLWITDKAGSNSFAVKDSDGKPTGKRRALAGWEIADDICMVTLGKSLSDLQFEEKMVNQWDADAKKELPKKANVAVEILGSKVTLGIRKTTKFKQVKNNAGEYVDTNETRDENDIQKVFEYNTKATVPEARKAQEEGTDLDPQFFAKWVEKNKGVTRDLTKKGPAKGNGGKAAPQAGEGGEKRTSLFGKK